MPEPEPTPEAMALTADLMAKARTAAEVLADTVFEQERFTPRKHHRYLVDIGISAGMTGMMVVLDRDGMLKPPEGDA